MPQQYIKVVHDASLPCRTVRAVRWVKAGALAVVLNHRREAVTFGHVQALLAPALGGVHLPGQTVLVHFVIGHPAHGLHNALVGPCVRNVENGRVSAVFPRP